ncbi:MAG: helix-turn-helix domain-containing protein [Actinobacteria bacterium]|nr:helix-turn-helix domain-containing protein [Actinomycetota bacterium]
MVETDAARVEQRLLAGEYGCPDCDGELRPWGHARARVLGRGDGAVRIRPRRARCRNCRLTHVLLAVAALLRRCDLAEAIGEALALKVTGWGYRRIAAAVGVPASTVGDRGRRFAANAEAIRVRFATLAFALDAALGGIEPRGSPLSDALEAVVVAAGAAARAFGPAPLWSFAAGASGGRLLANTNPSLPLR